MNIVIVIIGVLLTLVGIVGSVLPAIPGPQLGFVALLLLQFTKGGEHFSWLFIIIWGIINIVLIVLDYVIPIIGTKKFGGTKAGVRGSTIGLIVGVIVLPLFGIVLGPFGLLGLIGGPFVGAFLGEKIVGKENKHALKSAFGSFIGFLTGTLLKVVVCIIMAVYFFVQAFRVLF